MLENLCHLDGIVAVLRHKETRRSKPSHCLRQIGRRVEVAELFLDIQGR